MALTRTLRSPSWFIASLAIFACPALGGATDEEFQVWSEKVRNDKDDEGFEKGKILACIYCNIVIDSVGKQLTINKQKKRAERYSEESMKEVLLDLCKSSISERVAKSIGTYRKDTTMVCNRMVNENLEDMLAAASLGEDVSAFCKENGLCPMTGKDFNAMTKYFSDVKKANEAKDDPKEKKEEEEEEGEPETVLVEGPTDDRAKLHQQEIDAKREHERQIAEHDRQIDLENGMDEDEENEDVAVEL